MKILSARRLFLSRKSKLTIERLWSVFAEIEARENLVSWQVGSIFIWPLIRASLMREVAEKLNVFEVRPPQAAVADVPAADIVFAPSNYAVVPFVRRNSAGLDPFSTYIVDSLVAHGEKPLILGMGPDDVGSSRPQVEQLEREFTARYGLLAKVLVAPTLRSAHTAKYARVIQHLEDALHVARAVHRLLPPSCSGAARSTRSLGRSAWAISRAAGR